MKIIPMISGKKIGNTRIIDLELGYFNNEEELLFTSADIYYIYEECSSITTSQRHSFDNIHILQKGDIIISLDHTVHKDFEGQNILLKLINGSFKEIKPSIPLSFVKKQYVKKLGNYNVYSPLEETITSIVGTTDILYLTSEDLFIEWKENEFLCGNNIQELEILLKTLVFN